MRPSLISPNIKHYSRVAISAMRIDVGGMKIDAQSPDMAALFSAKPTIRASSDQCSQCGTCACKLRECVIHLSNETR